MGTKEPPSTVLRLPGGSKPAPGSAPRIAPRIMAGGRDEWAEASIPTKNGAPGALDGNGVGAA